MLATLGTHVAQACVCSRAEEGAMTIQDGSPRGGVAAEVLGYLLSCPNAADTAEGIMRWWLPRQRYETEKRKVEAALDELTVQGLITKVRLVDGTILYSRPRGDAAP